METIHEVSFVFAETAIIGEQYGDSSMLLENSQTLLTSLISLRAS